MIKNIGEKVKVLRSNQGMTLKELSEKTKLSIGFLSQLERGLTTVAIDSLDIIAEALNVDLQYFFDMPKNRRGNILRSFEKEIIQIDDSKFIQYSLSGNMENKIMLPRLIEILPGDYNEDVEPYQHDGEEFIYVLEGILTTYLNDERNELYPGDSVHISSKIKHNWANHTSKVVKIITINTPVKY